MRGNEMKQRMRGTVMALMMLLAVVCGLARAQSNSATVTGVVADKTGAVIPGASVLLTDQASGVQRTATSDGAGFFSLVGVPVAVYDVKVLAPGFNSMVRKGVALHINDQVELKGIVLAVAATSAEVVVTATADEMTPTTSGDVSYTLSDSQLHNMDIEGRSAIELLGLIPGAGNTGNFNGTYSGAAAGFTQNASAFTVNGNRFDQVAVVSDGASVSDLNTAGSAAVTPNVDMISELKVESAAYSAAEPNGPVVVSTETKSGGRTFHGMGQLTVRNHAMNAADWQQKYYGLPAPQTSLFYPAFQLGGPVKIPGTGSLKDKLFFFAATEIAQQHVDLLPRKSAVPTAAMRTGDFGDATYLSGLSNSGNNWLMWPVANNPCSSSNTYFGEAFWNYCSNNASGSWGQINSGMIDPGGKILLNAFPLPNVDPATHGGYNLITDYTTSNPRNQETLKLDYAISDATHASVRYNHENESVPSPYGPWNQWNQVPYPGWQTQKNASDALNAKLTNAWSSTLTNEASLSYMRFTLKTALSNLDAVSRTATAYPYANLFSSSSDLLPNVSFEKSVGGLYIAGGEAPPYLGAQNNYVFSDGVTKLLGKHLLRAGFYAQYARYNIRTTGTDNGSVDTQNYVSVTGNDWADLLLGLTANFSQSSGNINGDMATKRFDFYLQDAWKATSRLTLNYGLRVDHIGWWYDRGGRIAIFNPAAYDASSTYTTYSGMQSHATTSAVPVSGSKPLDFQLAPSVGFAYDVAGTGKTVVRGGFGTNYYNDPGINAFSAIMAPPNFKVVSLWASSTPYTLNGVSSLDISSTVPTVWGTANPSDHLAPVTYSWNAAVSQMVWGANKVEANYVGNSSHNLVGYGVRNAVPEGSETGPWYGTYYDQLYRPYSLYGDISTHFHNLNSNYNALQATVTRQKGWLNYWASYTFGKTLAYNAEDAFDMKRWYGPAPFDRSQIVSFSYYLKMPAMGSKYLGGGTLAKQVADGWQFSGIFQAMTGGPISNNFGSEYAVNQNTIGIWGTVSNTVGGQTNTGVSISNGAFATGTPNETAVAKMICDPRKGLAKNQYFNPACFVAPSYLQNGTYRLPYIHGPAYINDSIGLFKTFEMGESRKLEVRGEAFNLFNHAWNEFIAYDPNMYMGFSEAGGATSSTSAGTIDNKTGHREISLAAKFYF
ncbi:MAG TPA: carboxypeptidase regulatory-like domain-containing protein [Terracidiphilus sp.]|nr:carboxypeptidase regulatory-like domain-containing protein [Terracidiphilus sp.]